MPRKNKIMTFTNSLLFLLGLAECPIKPVDTSINGIEKDWQNIGKDMLNAIPE